MRVVKRLLYSECDRGRCMLVEWIFVLNPEWSLVILPDKLVGFLCWNHSTLIINIDETYVKGGFSSYFGDCDDTGCKLLKLLYG